MCLKCFLTSQVLSLGYWQHPHGTLHKSAKSNLLEYLEKDIPDIQFPTNIALVIDTFANIKKLEPTSDNRKPSTFTKVVKSILYAVCEAYQDSLREKEE